MDRSRLASARVNELVRELMRAGDERVALENLIAIRKALLHHEKDSNDNVTNEFEQKQLFESVLNTFDMFDDRLESEHAQEIGMEIITLVIDMSHSNTNDIALMFNSTDFKCPKNYWQKCLESLGATTDGTREAARKALIALCLKAKAITKTFLVNKLNADNTGNVNAKVSACKLIKELCESNETMGSYELWDCTNALKKLRQLLDDKELIVRQESLKAAVVLRNSRSDDLSECEAIEKALLETDGLSPNTRRDLEFALGTNTTVRTTTTKISTTNLKKDDNNNNINKGENRLLEMRSPINAEETATARRRRKQTERLQTFQSDDALPKEAFLSLSAQKSRKKMEEEEEMLENVECTQHTLEDIAKNLADSTSLDWEKRVLACKKIIKLSSSNNNDRQNETTFRTVAKEASIVLKKQNGSIKKFGESNAFLNIIEKLSFAVHDQRSAVAKAGCAAVSSMAQYLKGDLSDEFLDILIPALFEAVIKSIGIISESGDSCILEIIRNCFAVVDVVNGGRNFHLAELFSDEILTSKVSKIAKLRAKCAFYLSECFSNQNMDAIVALPKIFADISSNAIEKSLKDADANVRTNGKLAYEKLKPIVDASYFDSFTERLGSDVKKRMQLLTATTVSTAMMMSDNKNRATQSKGESLQDAIREQKRKLKENEDERTKGDLTEVIEFNAVVAAQNNLKAYNDRIGQPVDDDFTIDLPPRQLSIQTPITIKPALKRHSVLGDEKAAAAAVKAEQKYTMMAINEDEEEPVNDASLPPKERLMRSLEQAEVADSSLARGKAAERLRDALEDIEQLILRNGNTNDDYIEAISADFLLRAASALARMCADDVVESQCFVPALDAVQALSDVSSLRMKQSSSDSNNDSFMKEFKFSFAESTKILAVPLFGRLAGEDPNARSSASNVLISLARNVDLDTGLLPALRRAFVSLEATESDTEKCDRARTGVAQFSAYALSAKTLSKTKIARVKGSDELRNWTNTLARCASKCALISANSNLYEACVNALRIICFDVDKETVEKVLTNSFAAAIVNVVLKEKKNVPVAGVTDEKSLGSKKISSLKKSNASATSLEEEPDVSASSLNYAGQTPGALLNKSTGRRKSVGSRKTPQASISMMLDPSTTHGTDKSIPMTISPSPISNNYINLSKNKNNTDINEDDRSFGLDVSQMNNLMQTTAKKNPPLVHVAPTKSTLVKSTTTTKKSTPLGVGSRVMRALDVLKTTSSTDNERKLSLESLLQMAQEEYGAFKPFITLIAPTCVSVAEKDSDGVCRFFARRVLEASFGVYDQEEDDDNAIIIDSVTSLVPIFLDRVSKTSLTCLKLLLNRLKGGSSSESATKIFDSIGTYVFSVLVNATSTSAEHGVAAVKKEACACVAIALQKIICSQSSAVVVSETVLAAKELERLLKADVYSLNCVSDVEKKSILQIFFARAISESSASAVAGSADDVRFRRIAV